ncbi:hypothetical protein DID76_00575 [Candidatus Marinamargulisbacteria bacterium SCGC AG-414-C22]|nr:hypothetical protein DID76_00575 [Candidatus Marinamargulisbacteria bacterium SCGC AG-414-C22]
MSTIVNKVNILNQELADLPGFEPFQQHDIDTYFTDPYQFSLGFNKEKGKGLLYSQKLATLRQSIFNQLTTKQQQAIIVDKFTALGLTDHLTTRTQTFSQADLTSIQDIGMGHSVYLIELSERKQKVVVKQVDNHHPIFYYDLLRMLKLPTLDVDIIDNKYGKWIISDYIEGNMLTEETVQREMSEPMVVQLARHAACADMFGRGDRHLENYLWANNNLFPVDISYLFYPKNEAWVDRYIAGGQAEYCVLLVENSTLNKQQEKFWECYKVMLMRCLTHKKDIFKLIEQHYPASVVSEYQLYSKRVLNNIDGYVEQQQLSYNKAFAVFQDRYQLKKKLEKKALIDPSVLNKDPFLKMYHDANKNRLTAFFLIDYFERFDRIKELIAS